MQRIVIFFIAVVAGLLLATPFAAHAAPQIGFEQGGVAAGIGAKAGYDAQNADTALSSTVGKIINVVLSIMGTLFLALLIYGGVIWMIARGEETEITKAKDIIKAAVIGLAIVLSAYAISNFVVNSLLKATSGSDVGSSSSGAPANPSNLGEDVPYFETDGSSNICPNFKSEEACLFDPDNFCAWNPTSGTCEKRQAMNLTKTCRVMGGECIDVGQMGSGSWTPIDAKDCTGSTICAKRKAVDMTQTCQSKGWQCIDVQEMSMGMWETMDAPGCTGSTVCARKKGMTGM